MQPEVRYRAHSSLRLFPVLSRTDPVHSLPCYFFNVRLNIIFSSKPTVSSMWAVSFGFLNQIRVCISVPLHATCPAHLILLGLFTWLMSGADYKPRSCSLCTLLQSPVTSFLSRAPLFLSTCSRTPSASAVSSLLETKFHTHVKQKAVLQFCVFNTANQY